MQYLKSLRPLEKDGGSASPMIEFAPTLGNWYKVNRYGKANLAP